MIGVTLSLNAKPPFQIDASQLGEKLRSHSTAQILQLRLPAISWNDSIVVNDFFDAEPRTDSRIVIQGDLANFHGIGTRWSAGELVVEGNVGDCFASQLSGGTVSLCGNAGSKTAQQMRAGNLRINGNVGDDLGGPLNGRRSGVSGGVIHVIGNVGNYAGYRMRRGMLMIQGNCGTFLGCDIVAGTIIATGKVDDGFATGMHRGTLIVQDGTPFSRLRFTQPESQRLSIAALLANEIQPTLPTVASALRSPIARSLGDLTCSGTGEIWFY